ncbi:transmembrane amino acid transporter protein [Ancylostoma duodenale]|uniref:Transmembrane amino acid transporter protein n=1 Tax=Ancylostoma duodenale TaxID=51022 RepID=A0A0C2GDC8_9BILA|nr:transmembrane amino acid transporter protein [Ancylostoma duodenale]
MRLGKEHFRFAVNLCIIGLQLGICSAFYIFVVDHVKEQMLFMEHVPMSYLPAVTSVEGVTLAAGSIIYAYAAQGVVSFPMSRDYTCSRKCSISKVLPLENKMRKPQDMLGFFGVISISVAFIFAVYVITGFLGYLTYGEHLKGSITLNLTNSPLDFSVKAMLLLMTYCGYLIQHYPIVEMLWPYVQQRFNGANECTNLMLDYALRYTVVVMSCKSISSRMETLARNVLLAVALAYAIPNFKEIIPFVGITTGMMLALFFPPLLETVVFLERWRRGSTVILIYNVTLNIFYIILGVAFVLVGIYSNYRVLSDPNRQ